MDKQQLHTQFSHKQVELDNAVANLYSCEGKERVDQDIVVDKLSRQISKIRKQLNLK